MLNRFLDWLARSSGERRAGLVRGFGFPTADAAASAVVDYQCAVGYAYQCAISYASNCLNEERCNAQQQLRAARNALSTAMRRAESVLG